MIHLRSMKLSVLVLSLACLGISNTNFAGECPTTKCSTTECKDKSSDCCTDKCSTKRCATRCEGAASAQQLLMDAGSLSLSVLTYYLYASKIRPSLLAKADNEADAPRHYIVEELAKVVAGAWFIEQAKDFAKSLRCYLLGKVAPVVQEAQSLVGQ